MSRSDDFVGSMANIGDCVDATIRIFKEYKKKKKKKSKGRQMTVGSNSNGQARTLSKKQNLENKNGKKSKEALSDKLRR